MLRKIVVTAMMVMTMPTAGMAQREEHPPRERPAPGGFRGPHPGGPPGPGEFRGPRPGGPPGRFLYQGRPFNRVHIAPFLYPPGWAYRRWAIGAVLPPLFLAPAYYYSGWAALGLPPPQPGFQWVRYGPDLLLVSVTTGQVVDTVYGAFY
jgi:Nickel/cobalt transporter regulator